MNVRDSMLESAPLLHGDTFSAADVLYGSTFGLFLGGPMMPEDETLRSYVNRCTSRPAQQRAAARDNG